MIFRFSAKFDSLLVWKNLSNNDCKGEKECKAKRIEKTSHNYEILPSNNNKHYCLNENCNLTISSPEDHNYSVVEYLNNEGLEGKIGRLYICDDCDYQYFIENNPSVHTPRIVISEAYTLSENKIVDSEAEIYCFNLKGKNVKEIGEDMKVFIPKIYELVKNNTLI